MCGLLHHLEPRQGEADAVSQLLEVCIKYARANPLNLVEFLSLDKCAAPEEDADDVLPPHVAIDGDAKLLQAKEQVEALIVRWKKHGWHGTTPAPPPWCTSLSSSNM